MYIHTCRSTYSYITKASARFTKRNVHPIALKRVISGKLFRQESRDLRVDSWSIFFRLCRDHLPRISAISDFWIHYLAGIGRAFQVGSFVILKLFHLRSAAFWAPLFMSLFPCRYLLLSPRPHRPTVSRSPYLFFQLPDLNFSITFSLIIISRRYSEFFH